MLSVVITQFKKGSNTQCSITMGLFVKLLLNFIKWEELSPI